MVARGGALTVSPLARRLAWLVPLALLAAAVAATGGRSDHSRLRLAYGAVQRDESVSANWAGYVAGGTTFSDVKATWVAPRVKCDGNRPLDASSFWIGLGGASFTSPGLEQTGTSADCVRGRANYYAWYEILPAPATNVSLPVLPGDTISAEVSVTGGVASFTLQNLTRDAVLTKQLPVRFPAVDSAEWIAEAPSVCGTGSDCQTLPLAHFGSVLFTSATASDSAHTGTISDGSWTIESIRLANRSGPFSAAPSGLSADGSSFSVATHGPRVKTPLPNIATRLPTRLLLPAA